MFLSFWIWWKNIAPARLGLNLQDVDESNDVELFEKIKDTGAKRAADFLKAQREKKIKLAEMRLVEEARRAEFANQVEESKGFALLDDDDDDVWPFVFVSRVKFMGRRLSILSPLI